MTATRSGARREIVGGAATTTLPSAATLALAQVPRPAAARRFEGKVVVITVATSCIALGGKAVFALVEVGHRARPAGGLEGRR